MTTSKTAKKIRRFQNPAFETTLFLIIISNGKNLFKVSPDSRTRFTSKAAAKRLYLGQAYKHEKPWSILSCLILYLPDGGEAHGRASRMSLSPTQAPAWPLPTDTGCPPGASRLRQVQP
jgi:hypothetical protein